jgi:3-oxoacyl-[acyl-carrier-protein] synthase II
MSAAIRIRAQATLSGQGIACDAPEREITAAGFQVPPHAAVMKELFGEKTPRRLDRLSELVLVASGAAMRGVQGFVPERAGVFFATGQGNFSGTMGFLEKLREKGARFASPIEFPNLVISAPAGSLSFQFGFKGEVFALNQGRLAGLHALAVGVQALRAERLDLVLVAGAEEHSEGRATSAALLGRSEPGRDPLPLGEGAAALVLDRGPVSSLGPGVFVAGVAMNGLGVSDGLLAAKKSCLYEAGLAHADRIVTHTRHVPALQRAGEQAPITSLCDRVGELDVRNLLDVAWAAAAIRRGECRSVLVLDADENSGAAAVLLQAGA